MVTLGDIFCGIVASTVESGSSFQMPPELQDQPFVCSMGKRQNGPFQDCPCSITARDAIEFAGKFIRYHVEPADAHRAASTTATRGSPDAFSVLMSSQWEIQFVQRVSNPRNKEELANVASWLENNKGVGFQPTDVETKRKSLSTLADALWVINGHLETLSDRNYTIPTEFSCFSGYNIPEASKHKWKTLKRTAVEVNARKLFELLEKPWMSQGRCSVIREPVEKLAQSLHGYSTYLLSQSKKAAANHALLHPIHADDNSISFLDPVSTIRPTVCE